MSTLDLYALPVHPVAAVFPMLPEADLATLAADIGEHGLRQPVAVARIDGTLTLIDGRNRLAACRQAGVEPTWEELPADTDPAGYIISANIARRHLTKGQQAMAVAMVYPKAEKGGRGRNAFILKEFSDGHLSRARFVLQTDKEAAQRVLSGAQSLGDAYDIAKGNAKPEHSPNKAKAAADAKIEEERQRGEEWRQQAIRDARKCRDLEAQLLKLASGKRVEVVEKVIEPADYSDLKARALDLERQLDQQRKARAHDVRVEVDRYKQENRRLADEAESKAASAQQMMSTAQETMDRVRTVTGAHNRVIQAFVAAGRRLDDALAALVEHPAPPSDESRYAAATLATRARLLADRLDGWRGHDTVLLEAEAEPETPYV